MSDSQMKWLRWGLSCLLGVLALLSVLLKNQINTSLMTSMAVQIPEIVATAINVGLVALLTAGFLWVFNTFGLDFRGLVPVISVALSAWIVAQVQDVVNTVPASFDPLLNAFFYLLTLLLAPVGLLYMFSRQKESHKLI